MRKLGALKTLLMIAMAFVLVAVLPITARAETSTLATNGSWVSASISKAEEVDFYNITVPSTGWLTINVQGASLKDSSFYLLNASQTKTYWSKTIWSSSDTEPKTDTVTIAMNPGKYILKVKGYYKNGTGNYRVSASFKAAGTNDSASNDSFQSAQALTSGKAITGFLCSDDVVDFYKINLKKNTTVKVNLTSYFDNDLKIAVYDKNFVQIYEDVIWSTSPQSPKTEVYELALKKGVSYIKIYPYSNGYDSGKYSIKFTTKVLVKKITIKGQSKVVCGKTAKYKRVIAPSNAADKSVKWSLSKSDMGYINSETGKFTAYRPGKVKIIATAKDGSGKKTSITVTIIPRKMSSPGGYRSSSTGQPYFYWSTQSYVSGYELQITQGSFSNARTVTITNPKKSNIYLSYIGAGKYSIRIRSYIKLNGKKYYGAWSNPSTATIRPKR